MQFLSQIFSQGAKLFYREVLLLTPSLMTETRNLAMSLETYGA